VFIVLCISMIKEPCNLFPPLQNFLFYFCF